MAWILQWLIASIKRNFTPSASTMGWWKLDWDANDSSWNWNNGTATNVTYVAWKVNLAGSFNGTSSYITEAYSLRAVNTFTINAWVKTTDIANYRGIYSVAYNWSWTEAWVFRITNSWTLQFSDQFAVATDSNTVLSTNTWYMVTLVRKTNTTFDFYVNWALDKSFTQSVWTPWATWSWTLPLIWVASLSYWQWWNWLIDEMIIDNTAWNSTQVLDYYNLTK